MATVSYHIISHNEPVDHPEESDDTADTNQPWNGGGPVITTRRTKSPVFVAASHSYNEFGIPTELEPPAEKVQPKVSGVSDWYKSLQRTGSSESAPIASSSSKTPPPPKLSAAPPSRTKNDWFITRALASQPPPDNPPQTSQATLADMLSRDPPSTTERLVPPVWIALGPANKGFGMLQRSGWNEGEGLGPGVARREVSRQEKGRLVQLTGKFPTKIEKGHSAESGAEIIDLTVSDDESQDDIEDASADDSIFRPPSPVERTETPAYHTTKPLLTPLPIVLKADRRGVGQGKRKKAITHTASAIDAHVKASEALKSHMRASENLRKLKAKVGKGGRGFARMNKAEENKRAAMLAYMKAD